MGDEDVVELDGSNGGVDSGEEEEEETTMGDDDDGGDDEDIGEEEEMQAPQSAAAAAAEAAAAAVQEAVRRKCYVPSLLIDDGSYEVTDCWQIGHHIQGGHSPCSKPPVDIDLKVAL